MAKKLTDKQEAFCREYIVDYNATQAAIRAGYSEKTAKEIASENLTKPNVQERLQELNKAAVERNEIQVDEVLRFLVDALRVDISEFIENGSYGLTLKDLQELPIEARRLIHKVSFRKGSNVEFELPKKLDVAEKLMKYFGAYEKDNNQKQQLPPIFVVQAKEDD